MKKPLAMAGMVVLAVCLQGSPGYGSSRDIFSAGFRAGANVTVEAGEVVPGDLVTAGANLNLGGDFREGLKAFGANVTLPGNVAEDLVAAGANVHLSGTFHDEVQAFGANVVLAGTFDEDVTVAAARVILTPTAVVKGNLEYAAAVFDRQAGSQVLGEVRRKTSFERGEAEGWKEQRQTWGWAAGIVFWLLSTAALVLTGLLVRVLFPGTTERAVAHISDSPWVSLGVGLGFLLAVPVAILLAAVTVVGIPVAIIAAVLYMVFVYVSRVFIGVWIGRKVTGVLKRRRDDSFFRPLLIGIIVIGLIGLVPFLGGLFRVFCVLIGLGALWLTVWRSRSPEAWI